MRIEEMLISAAHFAGYLEAGYDDEQVFCIDVPTPERYKPWNPLEIDAHAAELIEAGKFQIFGSKDRIDAHGTLLDATGAIAVQVHIVELARNHDDDERRARRMAITKLAATLFDLRGVE